MERLRKADAEAGIERRALTDAQKDRIAELRRDAEAKLAEIDIMRRKDLAGAGGDPTAAAEIEERRRIDRERVERAVEAKIARIKDGRAEDDD